MTLLPQLNKALKKLFRKWQKLFGLTDWDLSVSIDTSLMGDDNADACVQGLVPERRYATISFSPDAKLGEIDYLICHELLHIVFSQRKDMLRRAVQATDASLGCKQSLLCLMDCSEEHDVDRIARTITNLARQKRRNNA